MTERTIAAIEMPNVRGAVTFPISPATIAAMRQDGINLSHLPIDNGNALFDRTRIGNVRIALVTRAQTRIDG